MSYRFVCREKVAAISTGYCSLQYEQHLAISGSNSALVDEEINLKEEYCSSDDENGRWDASIDEDGRYALYIWIDESNHSLRHICFVPCAVSSSEMILNSEDPSSISQGNDIDFRLRQSHYVIHTSEDDDDDDDDISVVSMKYIAVFIR